MYSKHTAWDSCLFSPKFETLFLMQFNKKKSLKKSTCQFQGEIPAEKFCAMCWKVFKNTAHVFDKTNRVN